MKNIESFKIKNNIEDTETAICECVDRLYSAFLSGTYDLEYVSFLLTALEELALERLIYE